MKLRITSPLLRALLIMSSLSVLLFIIRALGRQSTWLWFLNWNLFLAWVPLLLVSLLANYLKRNPWISWQAVGLSVAWLLFLPNSFYLVSDFIHLPLSSRTSILFDSVLIFSFSLTGFMLGIASLQAIHRLLLTRFKASTAWGYIAAVIGLCSFAIYLGRYLRWNTWDVLFNPAGLLFDVTDRIVNPSNYRQTIVTTVLFFALIFCTYLAAWQFMPNPVPKKKR